MVRVKIQSPNVVYESNEIVSKCNYHDNKCTVDGDSITVTPVHRRFTFRTRQMPAKTGLMLVGWGGNNGSTVTAGILANARRLTWRTRRGLQKANYFGSITQASVLRLGMSQTNQEMHVPLCDLVPMVDPSTLVVSGWDCSKMPLGDAMKRAQVLDVALQDQLVDDMNKMIPLPAIFDPAFVAANQENRANNIIPGTRKQAVGVVREHIRAFKKQHALESVIVLWTANTERYSEAPPGVLDSADQVLAALDRNEAELSPSACYAIASILEGCSYINGAPQNTFSAGVVDLANRHGTFLAGDDFKSGQTKMKSALVEFFVAAGIKPESIASYNHLGNNDGYNLSCHRTFRSKEVSKSNVIDDMVESNAVLFPPGSKPPDHCVVIKYMPYVGDEKRAMDEYIFSIFMGGEQVVAMHNTCQDSLLAAPLIIDLVLLTELMQRVRVSEDEGPPQPMNTILSLLSYLLKAPAVPAGTPVVNALARQRSAIENFLRVLVGLSPEDNLMLPCRLTNLSKG